MKLSLKRSQITFFRLAKNTHLHNTVVQNYCFRPSNMLKTLKDAKRRQKTLKDAKRHEKMLKDAKK